MRPASPSRRDTQDRSGQQTLFRSSLQSPWKRERAPEYGLCKQGGKVNDPYVSYSAWQNIVRWMLNLQAHGKGYYSINE